MSNLEGHIAALRDLVARLDANPEGTEPLERLATLRLIADTAAGALPEAVAATRAAEWSWTAVGRALGTTRQSAWQRYATGGTPPAASVGAPRIARGPSSRPVQP